MTLLSTKNTKWHEKTAPHDLSETLSETFMLSLTFSPSSGMLPPMNLVFNIGSCMILAGESRLRPKNDSLSFYLGSEHVDTLRRDFHMVFPSDSSLNYSKFYHGRTSALIAY